MPLSHPAELATAQGAESPELGGARGRGPTRWPKPKTPRETPHGLVRGGLATAHVERVRSGTEWLEVRFYRITAAGQQLIGKR